jgi:hypothetical protein
MCAVLTVSACNLPQATQKSETFSAELLSEHNDQNMYMKLQIVLFYWWG